MRLVNRIILVIVLLVLVVFGTFGAIYAFAGSSYQTAGLPGFLALPHNAQPAQQWLGNFERGFVPTWGFVILVLVFVVGLVLLGLEILPRRAPYLSLGDRLRLERKVVEREAERVALADPPVLESSARLTPKRGGRSKLSLAITVRRGEDAGQAKERAAQSVRAEIAEKGKISITQVTVKARVKDPRQAKRRVK